MAISKHMHRVWNVWNSPAICSECCVRASPSQLRRHYSHLPSDFNMYYVLCNCMHQSIFFQRWYCFVIGTSLFPEGLVWCSITLSSPFLGYVWYIIWIVRILLLIWMIVLCDVYDGWVCSSDVEGNFCKYIMIDCFWDNGCTVPWNIWFIRYSHRQMCIKTKT